jgi:16S rRNA (uracil1498-N3)-methyltransferase
MGSFRSWSEGNTPNPDVRASRDPGMNLILFESDEIAKPLPSDDPRARHLRDVLRRKEGETFDCGLIDGPRGKGRIVRVNSTGLELAFEWGPSPAPLDPLWLLIGLPRPQTARKILSEVAALGVAGICFFPAEKGERSYASSHLWSTDEARRLVREGVAQAFCTRMPACSVATSLSEAIAHGAKFPTHAALDNYEATAPLTQTDLSGTPAALAIGPERGWSAKERDMLRGAGFVLAHLGPRVLRAETAAIAGLTLLKARLGLL